MKRAIFGMMATAGVLAWPGYAHADPDDELDFPLPKAPYASRGECEEALAEFRRLAKSANSGLGCHLTAKGWHIFFNPRETGQPQ